ncbi:MAG: DUF3394 domain-containing protein, partial [Burkholderiaceae bacterium]|nr:DUF3394 domain-containing protein [Burkholderiaceae bacterium]
FIFNTQLLLIGLSGPLHLILTVVTAVTAMLVFAAATQGYFLVRSRWYETVGMLLVCFTLFRPGFWMDMVAAPFQDVKGEAMAQVIAEAPAGTSKRMWIEGLNLNGDEVRKGVLLPLGAAGDMKQRLQSAGVTVMNDGQGLLVAAVRFGSTAEKLGLEQGFHITSVEMPADRPAKEWWFVPALALLGLIVWAQRRRLKLQAP